MFVFFRFLSAALVSGLPLFCLQVTPQKKIRAPLERGFILVDVGVVVFGAGVFRENPTPRRKVS